MINHTASNVTPLYKIDEIRCWENRPFTRIWPEPQKRTLKGVTRTIIKKKHRKTRTTFTTEQLQILENNYLRNKYLDAELRRELAKSLNMDEKCIKVWFQNRRMKEKRESSEASGDSSPEILNTGNSQQATQYDINQHLYSSQYIPPDHSTFVTNQNYTQNYNSLSTQIAPDNDNTFYFDNNVYPTQYYPNYYGMSTDQYYNTQDNEIQSYSTETCTGFSYF